MTLSHRGEKDIYDLSCMTDVKKTDVWVRKILLMTSLQQLETTCQIDSNSFCCRTAQGNGSSALENTEGRKIGLTTSNKSLYHQESKIYQVKVLIFIIFRVQYVSMQGHMLNCISQVFWMMIFYSSVIAMHYIYAANSPVSRQVILEPTV